MGSRGAEAPVPLRTSAPGSVGEEGAAASGSGKRRERLRTVTLYCNADEYGGQGTQFTLDPSGCKSLEDVAAAVRRGFALPSARTVEVVTPVTGESVALDALHAPSEGLRLVLRIDGELANFRMERVRSNLPVKGFLDDLAACQYTLLSALCELVDNSVQATRSNERALGRKICVTMNTSQADPASRTVVIADNGEGFNMEASEEFATLGMRGEASKAGDSLGEGLSNAGTFKGYFSSILSRFGMGCKMAMNLIGDTYSLRTKTKGSPVVLEAAYDKFCDEYQYTERHVPCAPGEENLSFSVITIAGLQEGTTAACGASHGDKWPVILALNLRSLYFCHLEMPEDAGGRAGALRFADRITRGMEKSVFALAPTASTGRASGGGSRKRKSVGVEGSAGVGRGGGAGSYHEKAADLLQKTLNAFKNPQLKRKTPAVSLFLEVNGQKYLGDEAAAAKGDGGPVVRGRSGGQGAGKDAMGSQVEIPEPKCWRFAEREKARQTEYGGEVGFERKDCLWDYVLSDVGQDCFPLWFEVEEGGQKSVVMGSVFYFPIGEHSEEETAPRREVRVDMPTNSTEPELRFATLWMGRWLPGEPFVPPFMTYDNHKRPQAPARAYRRAFGVMFLDRTFRPQQNKVAIEPNRSLWLSLRREMDSERIFNAYDSWLLECNKRYDHEVSFETDLAHVVYDEARGMTRHKCVNLAGTKFKVADKIRIQKKGNAKEAFYAEIKDFWQDGHPSQGRKDGHVSVVELEELCLHDSSEVRELRFSAISMSKITPTKWKEESQRLSKNIVVDIAWENALLSGAGATLEAGAVLKHETVVCLNCEGKPTAAISKGSAGGTGGGLSVVLEVKTPRAKTNKFTAEVRDNDARTDGAKRFKFDALLDGHDSIFSMSGMYSLEFSLRRAKTKGELASEVLKTVSYSVTVVPGAPKSMALINREAEAEKCPVDACLPMLSFQLLDAFRNTVRADSMVIELDLNLQAPGTADKIPVKTWLESVDGGVISISDLRIRDVCERAPLGKWIVTVRASLTPSKPRPANQSVDTKGLEACDSISQISPGPKTVQDPKGKSLKEEGENSAKKRRVRNAAVEGGAGSREGQIVLEIVVPLEVIHGKPTNLILVSPATVMNLNNLSEFPKLEYIVKDCAGNTCTKFQGWVLVLSPALPDRMHVRIAQGIATFSQKNSLQLQSPIFKKPGLATTLAAWGTQEAAAFLAAGGGCGPSRRGKGARGKKEDKDAGVPLVPVAEYGGFFLGEREFIMVGDYVLHKDTPAQVLEIMQQQCPSNQVKLRCFRSVGCGGGKGNAAGGEDGLSVVSSKRGAPESSCKRVSLPSDAPEQLFPLERGLLQSRGYVIVPDSELPHDERFLNSGVFVCSPPPLARGSASVGLPAIAMDAFVIHGGEEPATDFSLLSAKLLVHTRTHLQIRSSQVPRRLDLVTAVVGAASEAQGDVKSVLKAGFSGKPGQVIGGLLLEIRDEAGCLCCDEMPLAGGAADTGLDGKGDASERWAASCSWIAEPIGVLKYQGKRVLLPQLRVPTDVPELDCTVWLEVDEDTVLEANFKVKVETGPPAQLALSAGPGAAGVEIAEAHIGSDSAFRLSVLDERGARIEVVGSSGGGWGAAHNTVTGALTLDRVRMTVTDASGKVNPVLVRQENFEKSTQTYIHNVNPMTEVDDDGNFWVRCVRLHGQVGPVVLRVEARVETENVLTDKNGDKVSKFNVQGELKMMLCIGKPAGLVLQGRTVKKLVAVGGAGVASQQLQSQVPPLYIRCQSFVQLDPLVVDVVDECGNVVHQSKGKVYLDFKGSGIQRSAVVSSRKAGGLPAEKVLHFERGDESRIQLLGLTFKESGSYSAAIKSLGFPDLPVLFEVTSGNVVMSLELQLADDLDLARLPLSARVSAVVKIVTEDGVPLTELDKTSITFVIESCSELQVAEWEFKGEFLHVQLLMPTHTCATDVYAVYSETREDYEPKPSDVESNRVPVQIVAGPVDHISLQTKKGNDGLIASEYQLQLPVMLVSALDEYDNKSSTLAGGERLECCIMAGIGCKGDELELVGTTKFALSDAVNPVAIKDLLVVRRDGAAIDFCEFVINLRVEPASLDIAPLRHSFTHSNNESISRKIKSLQNREATLCEQVQEASRHVAQAQQRMAQRIAQGFPDGEAECKKEKERLKKLVSEAKKELLDGERENGAEPGRHDVDVSGLQGVIGVLADLGNIDRSPHWDAGDIRKCLTWALQQHLKNVLFRTTDDVEVFDELTVEEKCGRRRIKRIYSADTLLECKCPNKPTNVDGCLGYAHEMVVVSEGLDQEDAQAARKMLNNLLSSILIFSQYNLAVKYQKAMVAQKKRTCRLVGLDRPLDIIDSDGGRQLNPHASTSRELGSLPALGIVAFGSSSLGKHIRAQGETAAKSLREFERQVLEHRKDVEMYEEQSAAHDSAEQEMQHVCDELQTLMKQARPPAAAKSKGGGVGGAGGGVDKGQGSGGAGDEKTRPASRRKI